MVREHAVNVAQAAIAFGNMLLPTNPHAVLEWKRAVWTHTHTWEVLLGTDLGNSRVYFFRIHIFPFGV